MTVRRQHPSIFKVGEVIDDGVTCTVRGWGLGLCASQCRCHRHPANGQLYIADDQERGTLGLRKFIQGRCSCCIPWAVAELAALLRDLTVIEEFYKEETA